MSMHPKDDPLKEIEKEAAAYARPEPEPFLPLAPPPPPASGPGRMVLGLFLLLGIAFAAWLVFHRGSS